MNWVLPILGVPVAALGAAALHHRVATALDRKRYPPRGTLVDVGGYRMHLLAAGTESPGRPTVILDSALAGTSLSWTAIQPEVAGFARTLSYDRAGFGWSDASPKPRHADVMVDELKTLLVRAGAQPPYILVGHSFGGWVAQLFTARYRDDVCGLVLVDVPHPREWKDPDPPRQRRVDRGVRLAREASWLAHFGLLRWLSVLVRLRPRFTLPGGERDRITSLLERTPPEIRDELRYFWIQPKTLRALASLIQHAPSSAGQVADESQPFGELPLVALTARNPSQRRLDDQRDTLSLSARSRHVIAERSGHWIPLDEPELIVEAVRDLVASHPS